MGEGIWVSLHKVDPMELAKVICRLIELTISDNFLGSLTFFLYLAISKPMWIYYPHLAMLRIVHFYDGKYQYNVALKLKIDLVV